MHALVEHEMDPSTPKNKNVMMQRLANAHLERNSGDTQPHSRATLRSEASVTILGGIIDLSNILPYASFHVSNNPALQQKLYEEIMTVWPDPRSPAPAYEVLRHLPYLVSHFYDSFFSRIF